MSDEVWEVTEELGGEYAVSNKGRIKSLERTVDHSRTRTQKIKEKVLSPSRNKRGHQFLQTKKYGKKYIHRIVAKAFIPNPDNLPVVRHLNDDPEDNRVENLSWGTQADNMLDASINGRNHETRKTHCPQGHPYSGRNLRLQRTVTRNGTERFRRYCRTCSKAAHRRYKETQAPLGKGDHRHGTLTGYSNWGCRCEPCRSAKRGSRDKEFK